MQTYEIPLTQVLVHGLRPFPETPDQPAGLEECYNLMPSELSLRGYEPITSLGLAAAYRLPENFWPYPRLLPTPWHVFYVTCQGMQLYLYQLLFDAAQGVWTATSIGAIGLAATIQSIDIADFGSYAIVAAWGFSPDATEFFHTMQLIPAGVSGGPAMTPLPIGYLGTVCNFRQQCVGGNVLTSFLNSAQGVQWSGIGEAVFDPAVDRTAGWKQPFAETSASGALPRIVKVLPVEKGVVAYSTAGRVLLMPGMAGGVFTYGEQRLPGPGVASGTHIAGDTFLHGWIDLDKDFWLFDGAEHTKRGYRTQLQALFAAGGPVIVTYMPRDKRFYVSNGLTCLLINPFGGCTIHDMPSGVVVGENGTLYGTFRTVADHEARITTDAMDFQSRGLKTLQALSVDVAIASGASCSLRTAYSMTSTSTYSTQPWRPAGPLGEAVVRTTAASFRVQAKVSTYVGTELRGVTAQLQYPDARFRRGVTLATRRE